MFCERAVVPSQRLDTACQIWPLDDSREISAWYAPIAGLILCVEDGSGDAVQTPVHAAKTCEALLLLDMRDDLCKQLFWQGVH